MYLLRVETNIKLQLIDTNGNRLIPIDDELKTEVHFIQLEAQTAQYPLSLSLNIFKGWLKDLAETPKYENQTITDFDYFLKGNPIMG